MAWPVVVAAGQFARRLPGALLNSFRNSDLNKEIHGPKFWITLGIFTVAFLSALLMLAVGPGTAGELTGVNNPREPEQTDQEIPPISGDCAAIAQKAAQEFSMNVVETSTNYSERIALYTDGDAEAWCADFVSWVLWQSGNKLDPNRVPSRKHYSADPTAGREPWVRSMITYFQSNEVFMSPSTAKQYGLQAGDIIFYDWAPDADAFSGHTGVVISYDAASGTITTIEGNRGDRVGQFKVGIAYPRIVGFGRLKACQPLPTQPPPPPGTPPQPT